MFKKIGISLALATMLVSYAPRDAYAGGHCDIKCIWTKIVKKNPSIPGICYVEIPVFAIDTVLKFVWSNYASEVTDNQNEEFDTLSGGSFSFGGGFSSSGSDGLVLVRQAGGSESFAVFAPDAATAKAFSDNLALGDASSSGASSNEIAAAIKQNVLVKPRGLTFEESKAWQENREDFFDETWKGGYSQSLSMQQALAKASEGNYNFITTIGDVETTSSDDEDDSDIRLMMDKYKDSLAALEEALLLATQVEASYQVLDAASGMIAKRTDDFEEYEG